MPSGAFLGFSALWPPLACTQHASETWGGHKPILQMQSGDSPRQFLVGLVAQLEMANPRFSKVLHIIHQHPCSRHSTSPHIAPTSTHLWKPGLPSSALPRVFVGHHKSDHKHFHQLCRSEQAPGTGSALQTHKQPLPRLPLLTAPGMSQPQDTASLPRSLHLAGFKPLVPSSASAPACSTLRSRPPTKHSETKP